MKRILALATIGLLTAAGLLLQCGKKSNPIPPEPDIITAPKITAVYPANNAAGLARNTLLYVTFDRPMNHSATAGALTVDGMTGAKSWSNYILIFKPDSTFKDTATVRFTVSTAAQDNNGTALAAAASYTFICGTSVDNARPAMIDSAPVGSAVSVNAQIMAYFNEKLAPWSDASITLKLGIAGVSGSDALVSDSILQFTPSVLLNDTTYTVMVDTLNCVDRCGNRLAAARNWSFTTEADTVRPLVFDTEPHNGDSSISVNRYVMIVFTEPMDTASVRAALTYNPTLHCRITWQNEMGMFLTMTDTLSFHTLHTVTIGIGATDKAGNHLATSQSFAFTTARGLYVACNTANETYLYQQNDLQPEGYLPYTSGITQVKISANGDIAYLLTNNGLHFRQVRNHNNEPFFTNLSAGCYGVAVAPDGARLAVSDTAGNRVYLISAATGQMLDTLVCGSTPMGMTFSSSSRYLYVLCQFSNRLEVYDLNNPATAPVIIYMPNGGEEMAITPVGDRVFAACGTGVSVIRTSDNTVSYDIPGVSNHPYGLAVSPDGQHLAVSCYDEGTVKVYALANYALVATVSVGTRPKGLCYSPDGKYLYVSISGASQVKRLVRASAYAVDNTLTVGAGPWGVAVTP